MNFFSKTKTLMTSLVAADVLPYFSELNALFHTIHKHLKSKAILFLLPKLA